MNAVLLIAHAPLAHALRECALHVFPEAAPDIVALDVDAHEPPERSLARAQALLVPWDERPVLLLTDMLGATPCNVAQRLADGVRTRLVAGVNLPMLLRALTYRAEPLEALAQRALDGGVRGVVPVAANATAPTAPKSPA